MSEGKSNYYAVIPANIRYSDISSSAKLLYGEISALCNQKGYCWANNQYFVELYQVHRDTISEWINQLLTKGFIKVSDGKGKNRKIAMSVKSPYLPRRKHLGIQGENTLQNNTVNNSSLLRNKEGVWSFKEEIKKFEDSNQRHLNILAFYFTEKELSFDNKEQFKVAIGRHIKDASKLKGFTNAQLIAAAKKADERYKEIWTLSTLVKILTR